MPPQLELLGLVDFVAVGEAGEIVERLEVAGGGFGLALQIDAGPGLGNREHFQNRLERREEPRVLFHQCSLQ